MSRERGSMVVESLVLVPALMAMTLLVVHAGTTTHVSMELRSVVGFAARRGSLSSLENSVRVAERVVADELRRREVRCIDRRVVARVSRKVGTDHLVVTLECRVPARGLGVLGVPDRRVRTVAASVFDRYRRA